MRQRHRDPRDDVPVPEASDPSSDPAALVRRALAAPPRCGAVRVVCVDGPAGAGKTTLADAIARAAGGAPVVHLDDLYEGWAQPLGAPLAGRLRDWLLDPWAAGHAGRHPRWDWAVDEYAGWVTVPAAPLVVLEGCGSAASGVRERAALVVWVEADEPVRLARGLARDGAGLEPQWRAWQAAEAAHFAADGTQAAADVIVQT
jgi:uridine kinase